MPALLFTDIVDSTRVVQQLGDDRAAVLWDEHDRRARELLRQHAGREIDRSDGFFLLFDRAADAARYALAYHAALAALGLAARVGLHVGPVSLRHADADAVSRGAKPIEVDGLAKPVAARVMALARGGQSLLTAPARDALADDGSAAFAGSLRGHGHYRLKGLDEPIELFELCARDGPAGEPPADGDKAYRVVRSGDFWRPGRDVRHNLPAERDAFVGRVAELHALRDRLDGGSRLVTLLGPGGTGKTRLALRYGRAWLGDWPGGVWFCDLSEARSIDGLHHAVAGALEVPLVVGDAAVQLGDALRARGRCLVVLDNFEQLVAHAPATLGRWLDRAADASFVVTSRERLQLPGEDMLPIEPLPTDGDAIDLFVARARAQLPDFTLDGAHADAVATLVRLVDGLPLAIELAAARVGVLAPAQIVERMRDRFALLGSRRGAAARQATMRATIDWSWQLLAPWEQAALSQCSVFEGGFTLAAAEAVLDLAAWPDAPPALDVVQALLDKSLLRRWPQPDAADRHDIDEPYFGMYLSVHDYAREKRHQDGSASARSTAERHGRYYAGFGTDAAIESLYTHGGTARRHALEHEVDNLVAACRQALARDDGRTAVRAYAAAWAGTEFRGPYAAAITLGRQVLASAALADDERDAARLTLAEAAAAATLYAEAAPLLEQAITGSRERADRRRMAEALTLLGSVRGEQDRTADAEALLKTAIEASREAGARRCEGVAIDNLAKVMRQCGRLDAAQSCYEHALAIHREIGNRRHEGSTLNNLSLVHRDRGDTGQARPLIEQALAIHRETGNRRSEAIALGNIAYMHQARDEIAEAQRCYDTALAIARDVGDRKCEGFIWYAAGWLALDQGRNDEAVARFEHGLAVGRETGSPRWQGPILQGLAEATFRQGRLDAARDHASACEAILRRPGHPVDLAHLLAFRGHLDLDAGRIDDAKAALAEATALADASAFGAESHLRQQIDELARALADS